MKWHELTIFTHEEAQEMISNFLHESGAGGVSIEESGTLSKPRDTSLGQWYDHPLNDIPEDHALIKGYYPEETDMCAIVAELKPRIEQLPSYGIEISDYKVDVQVVDDEDWADAWKKYFKPLRVSQTLTIKPTWEDYKAVDATERIIELDPGMAFGTGAHPTTTLCLKTLEHVIVGGEDVIDVGTGSGILAIGAVRLGAANVLAVDLDPVAVTAAKANAELNGLSEQIQVEMSDLLGVVRGGNRALNVKMPVDLVVANILAEIILLFIADVHEALKPGGYYIASGIWQNKEAAVAEALLSHGFDIVERNRDQDWIAFIARKI